MNNTQISQLQNNINEMNQDFTYVLPISSKVSEGNSKQITCDLMIILDCTGSMESLIYQCKTQILNIIESVKDDFYGSNLRVGFVAYRDFCDGDKRIEKFPFINDNYESLEAFIGSLRATGGGDIPEDLSGALDVALNQYDWTSESKIMILITDAPCHGSKYHSCSDDHPKGDPHGKDIEEQISIIGKRGIDLNVVMLGYQTLKMYDIFSEIYKNARQQPLVRLDLKDNSINFGDCITQTVSATITNTYGNSKIDSKDKYKRAFKFLRAHKGLINTRCLSQTELEMSQLTQGKLENECIINEVENEDDEDDDEEEEKKEQQENESNDKLKNAKSLSVQKYIPHIIEHKSTQFSFQCNYLTPYLDNKSSVDWNNPTIKVQQLSSKVKIDKDYFAEGAMRYAFHAEDTILNEKLIAKLHKNLKDNSDFQLMKRDCMSLIACHYFVEEFNSRILLTITVSSSQSSNQTSVLLNFVNSSILEVMGHINKDIKYYSVENVIQGNYQKYNNNAGWINSQSPSAFNELTQAFSHFTWQYSRGELLVVDIQGGQSGVLTDPQIHTKCRSRLYGKGDLGYEGMMRFFWSHRCNTFCKQLGLIHPKKTNTIPNQFDFYSDLFGLLENQKETESKKAETILPKETEDKGVEESANKEQEDQEINKEEVNIKKKKNKKKKGPALKAEIEKQKALEIAKAKLAEEKEKGEEKTLNTEKESQNKICVGVQCNLCKKCFTIQKQKIIEQKKQKIDSICESCELQCQASQIDISCMTCGCLFQISKFYCKSKKINLIGKCSSCRD